MSKIILHVLAAFMVSLYEFQGGAVATELLVFLVLLALAMRC